MQNIYPKTKKHHLRRYKEIYSIRGDIPYSLFQF